MEITDRPGRFFALSLFAPFLFYSAITINPHYKKISFILLLLSHLLFFYELLWICNGNTDKMYINL